MYPSISGSKYISYRSWQRSSWIFLLLQDHHLLLVHMWPYNALLHLYSLLLSMPSFSNQAACFLRITLTHRVTFRSIFILTPDFILAVLLSKEEYNVLMSVTCKFLTRVTLIKGADTWLAEQWAHASLNRLDVIVWGLSGELITNWDPKFLSQFWTALFTKLKIKLLYSTAYYP